MVQTMTDKDKLIELFKQIEYTPFQEMTMKSNLGNQFTEYALNCIVDELLANGVIVPPCKVGDTVYVKWRLTKASEYGIYPAKVYALRWDTKKNNFRVCVNGNFQISAYGGTYTHYYRAAFTWSNVGKAVFLTKEEAERALKEREKV